MDLTLYRMDRLTEYQLKVMSAVIRNSSTDIVPEGMVLMVTHRGRRIFMSAVHCDDHPTVQHYVCCKNHALPSIVVKLPPINELNLYANDQYPLIYFINSERIFTLDTELMKFKPTLNFKVAFSGSVEGVCTDYKGLIIMRMHNFTTEHFHGTLPEGYYGKENVAKRVTFAASENTVPIHEQVPEAASVLSGNFSLEDKIRKRQEDIVKRQLLEKAQREREKLILEAKEGEAEKQRRQKIEYDLSNENLVKEKEKNNEQIKVPSFLKNLFKRDFESDFLKRFKPIKVIGEGGFGCVFKAQHLTDNWAYAVKRIALSECEVYVDKALQEVRTLASLKHEGIVAYNSSWIEKPPKGWQRRSDVELLDKLKHRGELEPYKDDCAFIYIQMELCHQSLDDWLKIDKKRDLAQAKSWFKQIVSAVGYLHKKHKIHRDLKPSNILINEEGRLKICDLGLVCTRLLKNGQEIDATRSIAGTVMYMAPEQKLGIITAHYTSKVDIFSLGLIFTELCVRMSLDKTVEVFHNYQTGQQNTVLNHIPEVARFASWLANKDPAKRPDLTLQQLGMSLFTGCVRNSDDEELSPISRSIFYTNPTDDCTVLRRFAGRGDAWGYCDGADPERIDAIQLFVTIVIPCLTRYPGYSAKFD